MNYYSLLPLGSFFVNLVLWVYIYALYRDNKAARAYLSFLTVCGVWAFLDFFIWNTESDLVAKNLLHLQTPFWMSTSFIYLNFYYKLINRKNDFLFYFFFSGVILCSFLGIFTNLTLTGVKRFYWGILPEVGVLYYPALITIIIAPVFYFLAISIKKFTTFEPVLRTQILLSVGAVLGVFLTSIYINVFEGFIKSNTDIPALGSTFTSFQVIFIFIAIVKYEFLAPGPLQAANKLFANSSDGALILDVNRKIVEINENAEQFFKIDSRKIVGNDIETLISAPYKYDQDYDKLEITILRDSIAKTAVISQIPLLNKKLLIGKLLILHDLTEKKSSEQKRIALEKEVKESQDRKMRALGQLAGGIAHDFNNMLNGILGFTNILKADLRDRKDDLSYLENIEMITINAASLTKQMLTFARKNTGELKTLNISDSINRIAEILSHSMPKNIEINVNCEKELFIKGEASQVENMLMNLAVNSRDAMPDGGILNFSCKEKSITEKHSFLRAGDYVLLNVSDNGMGMNEDTQQHIYEPFFSTKSENNKGTGLGLASVYGIVKQHRGYIDVKSTVGAGTTFFIYFPSFFKKENEKTLKKTEASVIEITKKNVDISSRVLLIDDEAAILKSTSILLKREGYTVDSFNDGELGIEHFKEHNHLIDAIILDQTMPGLSGYECYIEIKKINSNIPVILTSGYNNSSEFETLIEDGEVHFLIKPYHHEELSNLLYSLKDSRYSN